MVVVILVESWLLVPGEQVKRYRSVGVWSRRQKNRTRTQSICARLSWISWSNLHATGFLRLGAQNLPIKRRGLYRGAIYAGGIKGRSLWQNTMKSSLVIRSMYMPWQGHQEQVSIEYTIQGPRWGKLQKHLWIGNMALKRMSLTTS